MTWQRTTPRTRLVAPVSPASADVILDERGGDAAVARGVGTTRQAIGKWRKKSVIPLARRAAVLVLPLQAQSRRSLAGRSAKDWTDREVATLRVLWKRGLPPRRIAAFLPGRTTGMVARKVYYLGLLPMRRVGQKGQGRELKKLASPKSVGP